MAKRFQITKFNVQSEQFKRIADKAVAAGLSWQEVCLQMTDSVDANVQYANAALQATGSYSFHNTDGELCEVKPHTGSESL